MKHYTSYYANYRNIPKTYMCIGISRYCPEWFAKSDLPNFLFVKDNILAPSEDLLNRIKSGKITEEEYKKEYITTLLTNLPSVVGYKDIPSWIAAMDTHFSNTLTKWDALVFMCYEQPNEFCHRHLFRRLLNNVYHIQCDEYGYNPTQQLNKQPIKISSEQLF